VHDKCTIKQELVRPTRMDKSRIHWSSELLGLMGCFCHVSGVISIRRRKGDSSYWSQIIRSGAP